MINGKGNKVSPSSVQPAKAEGKHESVAPSRMARALAFFGVRAKDAADKDLRQREVAILDQEKVKAATLCFESEFSPFNPVSTFKDEGKFARFVDFDYRQRDLKSSMTAQWANAWLDLRAENWTNQIDTATRVTGAYTLLKRTVERSSKPEAEMRDTRPWLETFKDHPALAGEALACWAVLHGPQNLPDLSLKQNLDWGRSACEKFLESLHTSLEPLAHKLPREGVPASAKDVPPMLQRAVQAMEQKLIAHVCSSLDRESARVLGNVAAERAGKPAG